MTDLRQAEPVQELIVIPREDSQEAAKAIQAMLAEYQYPANPTNAARAGWRAARLYAAPPQQQAEPVAQRSDGMPISKMERELRRMLCIERHGRSAYMDDGEASFCGDKYCRSIDYMRESVDSIKQAWYDAGVKKLAGAQPEQQAEPIGWLDGNDKLAEFMHRDLKAEHDKRGSATPKDFTIPVYTTLPQQQAEPVAWNKSIRDGVDSLLEQAGYQPDSSARHQLAMMNFDAAQPQRKPLTDEMRKQMKEASDSIEMRGAFANGWLSAEAAHGIKEME